ncbi:MAG: acyl-protein synthetase [Alphaproteobacteria bacterium]|nr:acyl-protein synthetase [Alphaproteobacteria bacterium]
MEKLLHVPPFSLGQAIKETHLLPLLRMLTAEHAAHCPAYAKILSLSAPDYQGADTLAALPFIPVSLFKHRLLSSVPERMVRTTLTSSGTSGPVSRIPLDAATAKLQARALAIIMQDVIGTERLPMLIIDKPSSVGGAEQINARAAGILGLMPLGRNHAFALSEDMEPNRAAIGQFLLEHGTAPFLMFGFTFMVWQHFRQPLRERGYDMQNGILLHSGGWKQLQAQAVDNKAFRSGLEKSFGLRRIHNFYGMAEQVGSIFVENSDGLLYPPVFADVIIRDPLTLAPAPRGEAGLIQVLSPLPRSYPGHSLLTEDIGRIIAVDSGVDGRMGKGFVVEGRVPRAPLRGCGDVHGAGLAA